MRRPREEQCAPEPLREARGADHPVLRQPRGVLDLPHVRGERGAGGVALGRGRLGFQDRQDALRDAARGGEVAGGRVGDDPPHLLDHRGKRAGEPCAEIRPFGRVGQKRDVGVGQRFEPGRGAVPEEPLFSQLQPGVVGEGVDPTPIDLPVDLPTLVRHRPQRGLSGVEPREQRRDVRGIEARHPRGVVEEPRAGGDARVEREADVDHVSRDADEGGVTGDVERHQGRGGCGRRPDPDEREGGDEQEEEGAPEHPLMPADVDGDSRIGFWSGWQPDLPPWAVAPDSAPGWAGRGLGSFLSALEYSSGGRTATGFSSNRPVAQDPRRLPQVSSPCRRRSITRATAGLRRPGRRGRPWPGRAPPGRPGDPSRRAAS